ncbi:MAG TPA: MBL fold metallo-hydrolase [Gemmataceae bacterium]|jgi:phosphoribosyl 1,2-cyclic phosphodiesterase|nr:MBL fold metallo-hydrolase [Gemmataceae bacterium]
MPARFCVLASGSSGNCAFVQTNGFGLLIDAGIGPRLIASRLAAVGAAWRDVHAVILTHTHTDHWKDLTLAAMVRQRVPLYCCPRHHAGLAMSDGGFEQLRAGNLVRPFAADLPLELSTGVTVRPIPVPHDSDPTYGFRIDGPAGLFGPQWSIGYASDLGEAHSNLIESFADVNVLALEFNHCVQMQRASGRPQMLIERVLGPHGHLSNAQAGDAVRGIVRASAPGSLKHLVQLHLSRECNTPTKALAGGREALSDMGSPAEVMTAQQFAVSRIISLEGNMRRLRPMSAA